MCDRLADGEWGVTSKVLAVEDVNGVPDLIVQSSRSVRPETEKVWWAYIVALYSARLSEDVCSSTTDSESTVISQTGSSSFT